MDTCPSHGNPACVVCVIAGHPCETHYAPWCQPCVDLMTGGTAEAVAPRPAAARY